MCVINALSDAVTLTFTLSIPKKHHFYDIPRSLPIPCFNTLGSFAFELCCGYRQTNRQTNKQTESNILPTYFSSALGAAFSNLVFSSIAFSASPAIIKSTETRDWNCLVKSTRKTLGFFYTAATT